MDVLDAGVYVSKWEADVPKGLKTVLWGPLQAKEMGFDGWQWQDGGETGFIAHNPQIRLPAGFATSTLIVVNRLRKAHLAVYFGGYPADAGAEQRQLDAQKVASACELFLSRLAKENIVMRFQGEIVLVDHVNDAVLDAPGLLPPADSSAGDAGARPAPKAAPKSAAEPSAAATSEAQSSLWEV